MASGARHRRPSPSLHANRSDSPSRCPGSSSDLVGAIENTISGTISTALGLGPVLQGLMAPSASESSSTRSRGVPVSRKRRYNYISEIYAFCVRMCYINFSNNYIELLLVTVLTRKMTSWLRVLQGGKQNTTSLLM